MTVNSVHFNTGIIVHQAGTLEVGVLEVERTDTVLLRLAGSPGNVISLADTPGALRALLAQADDALVDAAGDVGGDDA